MMSLDISDHALVRYIERVKLVSLEPYRNEIRALVCEHRDSPIPKSIYDDGFLFVLEQLGLHPTVVTVLTAGMRPKRTKAAWNMRTLVHVPDRYRIKAATMGGGTDG